MKLTTFTAPGVRSREADAVAWANYIKALDHLEANPDDPAAIHSYTLETAIYSMAYCVFMPWRYQNGGIRL